MRMATVEDYVGVVAWAVWGTEVQKGFHLGLQSLQGYPAGGIVTAKRLNQVVGKEALHVVQHTRRAPVQLVHLAWRQQHRLTVRTVTGRRIMPLSEFHFICAHRISMM